MASNEQDLSWFRLSANQDKELFKKMANDIKQGMPSILAMQKEMGNLSNSGRALAMQTHQTGVKTGDMSSAFLSASNSMGKMNVSLNLSKLGLQALSGLADMAFSLVMKGAAAIWDTMSTTLAEQQEKTAQLGDSYAAITQEIAALSEKKMTSPLDSGLTENENQRLAYLQEYQKELKTVLAAENEKEVLSKWFGKGNLNPFAKTESKETDKLVRKANNADAFLDETLRQAALTDTDTDTSGIMTGHYQSYSKDFIALLEKRNELETELKNQSYSDDTLADLQKELDKINPAIDKTKNAMERLMATGQIENPAEKAVAGFKAKFDQSENLKAMASNLQGLSLDELNGINLDSGDLDKAGLAFQSLASEASLCGLDIEDLKTMLVDYGYVVDAVSKKLPAVLSSNELSKSLSNTEGALSSLSNAWQEQAQQGSLSTATLSDLMLKHEDWASLVTIENDVITLNGDAAILSAKKTVQAEIEKLTATQTGTTARIAEYDRELTKLQELAGNATTVAGIMALEQQMMLLANETDMDQLKASEEQANKTIAMLEAMLTKLDTSNPFGNIASSAATVAEQIPDPFQMAYAEIQYQRDKGIISEKEYLDKLYLLNEQYNQSNLESWQKYDLEIANGKKQLFEKQMRAQGEAYSKAIDKRIKELNKQKEAESEYYDGKIKEINDEKQALQEQYTEEDKLLQLELKKQAIQKAKSQKTISIYRDGEFVWEADTEVVDDAQQDYDDAQRDFDRYQIEQELDKQIAAYEEAKQAALDSIESQIEDWELLKESVQEQLSEIGLSMDEHNEDMVLMAEAEKMGYAEMSQAITDYVNHYIAEMERMKQTSKSSSKDNSKGSGGKASDGGAHTNKSNYAKGRIGGKAEYAIVDEYGQKELIARNMGGRVTKLEYGDSVIPAHLTRAIFDSLIGDAIEIAPIGHMISMDKAIAPRFERSPETMTIQMNGDLSFPNVRNEHDAQGLINELCHMGTLAYQK